MIVQYLINIIKPVIQYEIPEDGIISRALIRTISQFQSIHLRFQHPDGVIEPEEYDQIHPFLSYKYIKKAGPEWQKNNEDQASAWDTLAKAYSLDADAAIKACSWGMFQIMGFNYDSCGYKYLDSFLKDMKSNAGKQLNAFLYLCNKNSSLLSAMVNKDFYNMAFNYNGSDFGDYDVKIRRTYESLEKKP